MDSKKCGEKLQNEEQLNTKCEEENNGDEIDKARKNTAGEKLLGIIWKNRSVFGKIMLIISFVVMVLSIVALCTKKPGPIVFSIIQIAGLIVAALIHKSVITCSKKWVKYIVVGSIAIFVVINIWSYSWGKKPSTNTIPNPDSNPAQISETIDNTLEEKRERKIPVSLEDCVGVNYQEIVNAFSDAGFINISTEGVKDLKPYEEESVDTISEVIIKGSNVFSKDTLMDADAEIVIKYHMFEKCNLTIHVDFEENWFFSTYDVDIAINEKVKDTMPHGQGGDYIYELDPGYYNISFIDKENTSIKYTWEHDVKGDIELSVKVSCHSDKVEVEILDLIDFGVSDAGQIAMTFDSAEYDLKPGEDVVEELKRLGFENVTIDQVYDVQEGGGHIGDVAYVAIGNQQGFLKGDILNSTDSVIVYCHAFEEEDPEKILEAENRVILEEKIPLELAKRALIVAMTNCQALDVFTADGNNYDEKKFHSYKELGEFLMFEQETGEWTAKDENTWHVEDMLLRMYNVDLYMRVSGDVYKDEGVYYVDNISNVIAERAYVDSDDPLKISPSTYTISDFNKFLVVPEKLISEDRNQDKAYETITEPERIATALVIAELEKKERQEWIESQFSLWDGRHKVLCDIIKDNLNDKKSFKHVESSYIDVTDDAVKKSVNSQLASWGITSRVEVGDLFVLEVFTAKNGFNATIKNTGVGIVKEDGTVTLVGIL